ncbi:MAG: hypothetical protein LLG05_16345 [Porphyromonadaceae bacterium]|nr:hypothetical protein [Porphyromonadaceae bacterium]
MEKATLRRIIEDRLTSTSGEDFQNLCDRVLLKLYPNDYTPIRPGGPKGDTKNDGYCPKARIYFAAHATRGEKIAATKKKIESDLTGCLKKHKHIKKWVYLTNDTLLGEVDQFVDELRHKHSELVIETWDKKIIAESILRFNEGEIAQMLDLDLGATVSIDAEIENSVQLLKTQQPLKVIVLLERLWEQHKQVLTGYQKYRAKANIGHAYDALENHEKAAQSFLEARQYDPANEKARAREALAYLYLGNRNKAHQLATDLISDFPEELLGRAVLVISTSDNATFSEIETMVPNHQRDSSEVASALAEAAIYRGHTEIGEKYVAKVLKEMPDDPQIKERLGDLMLKRARIEEQAVNDRGPTREETVSLSKAESLFSEAVKNYQIQNMVPSSIRTLLKRANCYMGLNEKQKMNADILFSYQLDASNPEAIFRYANMLAQAGNLGDAVSLLESLIGKGLRCGVELFLAQCLEKRNFDGDKKLAVKILLERLKDLNEEEPILRREYLATLVELLRQIEGIEQALQFIGTLQPNLVSAEFIRVLHGEVFRLNGEHVRAVNEANGLLKILNPDISVQDKRRIATLLQAVGMYKEALEIWKAIVRPEYIGSDTYRIMECAHQCEDVVFITEFSEKLRSTGLWERKLFDLELGYREKYHDDKGARRVMEEFLANPLDQSYVPYVRLRLSLLGIRTGKKELIELDAAKLPQVMEVKSQIGRLVAFVLRHGPEPIKGVEYAYELVRLNWNQSDAHMAMMESLFPPVGPAVDIKHPEEIIAIGSAVQYQEDDTHELRWYIIENSVVSKPESSRDEFPVDHPISKEMLGKKLGERFYLVNDGIQERTATIKHVFNKYVYRFQDCLNKFENRFPGTQAIKRMIIKEEGGKIDFSPIQRLAEMDAERVCSASIIKSLWRQLFLPLHLYSCRCITGSLC